jgi:peptide chain release factor 3
MYLYVCKHLYFFFTQNGQQSPLFFGSAMTNFGVELFLKTFLSLARVPHGRQAVVEGGSERGSVKNEFILEIYKCSIY